MASMAWRDAASAGSLALVSLYALVASTHLNIGTITRPGPGFFPCVLAGALFLVSLALLVRAWPGCHGMAPAPSPKEEDTVRRPWVLVATVAALAIYIAMFERAGFILATVALLAFLFGTLARYRWPIAIAVAVVVTLASYLVFNTGLQVRLPAGVWGW
jgi:putative tricarboxylic transport membrane protein